MAVQVVMALRAGRAEHTPESEPVVVDTDDPRVVALTLDDGERLELDATELRAALAAPREEAA